MLTLDEIIAEAEDTPRQHTDVEVVFNANISAELDALRDRQQEIAGQLETIESDLASELEMLQQDQRMSDSRPAEARERAETARAAVNVGYEEVSAEIEQVEARAAEFLVTFRITAMQDFEWDELTARSMPREGNSEDARVGYNSDELTLIVIKRNGVRVIPDGDPIDVTAEQWDRTWKALPTRGRRQLRNAVWFLHEYSAMASHQEAVVAARKVSAAQQAATQPSPSDSGSTPDASPAGNRSRSRTTSTTSKAD